MFVEEIRAPENHEQSKKTPITPQTAEGLTPSVSTQFSICDGAPQSLFQTFSCSKNSQFLEASEEKVAAERPIKMMEVQEPKYEFKFRINICGETSHQTTTLNKEIDRIIEDSQSISCILSKQFERITVQRQEAYTSTIFIVGNDGFERPLLHFQIKLEGQLKKWALMNVVKNEIKVDMEMECYKDPKIKFLGLNIPNFLIDNFFQERFDLLNKSEKLNHVKSLTEIKGILYQLSQQNMGSRIIQKLLTKANESEMQALFAELKRSFPEMVKDRYGNYVFQKIIKVSSPIIKKKCLSSLQKNFLELLSNKAGTFCLQGIIDFLDFQDLDQIQSYVNKNLVEICQNQFGSHFVHKLIGKQYFHLFMQNIVQNFQALAMNRYAIVVLKKLMQVCSKAPELRYLVPNACIEHFNTICFDEYGHYIIEQMLKYYSYYEMEGLLQHMTANVVPISLNQYSSSILKKCLQAFGDYMSVPMIERLLVSGLDSLMEDSVGNFVLHRLIELTQDECMVELLKKSMMTNAEEVKSYQKRQKWIKFFQL